MPSTRKMLLPGRRMYQSLSESIYVDPQLIMENWILRRY